MIGDPVSSDKGTSTNIFRGLHALAEANLYLRRTAERIVADGPAILNASYQGTMFDTWLNQALRPLITFPPMAFQSAEHAATSDNSTPNWFSNLVYFIMRNIVNVSYHTVALTTGTLAFAFGAVVPRDLLEEVVFFFL